MNREGGQNTVVGEAGQNPRGLSRVLGELGVARTAGPLVSRAPSRSNCCMEGPTFTVSAFCRQGDPGCTGFLLRACGLTIGRVTPRDQPGSTSSGAASEDLRGWWQVSIRVFHARTQSTRETAGPGPRGSSLRGLRPSTSTTGDMVRRAAPLQMTPPPMPPQRFLHSGGRLRRPLMSRMPRQ